jgi:hypothetical protein
MRARTISLTLATALLGCAPAKPAGGLRVMPTAQVDNAGAPLAQEDDCREGEVDPASGACLCPPCRAVVPPAPTPKPGAAASCGEGVCG